MHRGAGSKTRGMAIRMKIATILFTYNRSEHTKKVLDALRENTVHTPKLYIFQDGLKDEKHRDEWEKVSKVIAEVSWCDCKVTVSERNKGLARSIEEGIYTVLEENDAVIVLEDDCVPHPQFTEYELNCLEKYRTDDRVFCVNGSAWRADPEENGTDAYFSGRINSCGWATWKDRWQTYETDYLLLKKLKEDPYSREQFSVWGEDLESHLKGNIDGTCDSWAVFWALQCIRRGGFCPTPYESLITNIGFDGSGVHSGVGEIKTRVRAKDKLSELVLPDVVEFPRNYREAFQDTFHYTPPVVRLKNYQQILLKWAALNGKGIRLGEYLAGQHMEKVAIWGKGDVCRLLIQELQEKVTICGIVETNPVTKEFENRKVMRLEELPEGVQLIIVIPVYDMERICKKTAGAGYEVIGLNELLDRMETEKCR